MCGRNIYTIKTCEKVDMSEVNGFLTEEINKQLGPI